MGRIAGVLRRDPVKLRQAAALLTLPYWYLTGVGRATPYTGARLRQAEPGVAPDVSCALFFHRTGLVCPYGLTIALALVVTGLTGAILPYQRELSQWLAADIWQVERPAPAALPRPAPAFPVRPAGLNRHSA